MFPIVVIDSKVLAESSNIRGKINEKNKDVSRPNDLITSDKVHVS